MTMKSSTFQTLQTNIREAFQKCREAKCGGDKSKAHKTKAKRKRSETKTRRKKEMSNVLTNQPVVIDNGSGIIKAGFAGDTQPKCFFPSFVGRPKHTKAMLMPGEAAEGDVFIGPKAQEFRGLLKLRYPVEHGVVEDWSDMERIWKFIYSKELCTPSEEHPVLLTEPPLNPRRNREEAARILFETFNIPALYISMQAVLSLYSTGRTTGVVLDSGDGVTHAVPVYEGFAISHAIQRIDVAGRDVTDYLQVLLRKAGYQFTTSAEREIVREIKEKICFVSKTPLREISSRLTVTDTSKESYSLPDGTEIQLGAERSSAPEVLFDPELIGDESPGVHQILLNSIRKTDIDLRPNLYQNIVLSGGTTVFKGYPDRLLFELERAKPKNMKARIYAPPERKYSTWIGGSVLAGLTTFRKIWISANEYKEDPDIIHKKAF